MSTRATWPVIICLAVIQARGVYGQAVLGPVTRPVDHPAYHPYIFNDLPRTKAAWRQGLGAFGESVVHYRWEMRGYEVIDPKRGGVHGIDRIALKRNPDGTLSDVRIIEVKTHSGNKAQLAETKSGTQMSRQWLASKLQALRKSDDEQLRKLPLEIARFRKAKGVAPEKLGELHEINTSANKYIVRDPVTLAKRNEIPLTDVLRRIANTTKDPQVKEWAHVHLRRSGEIQRATMRSWLDANPQARALERGSSTERALLQGKQALRGAPKLLKRVAGPLAFVIFTAFEAYEIYQDVHSYQIGNLSRRELDIRLAGRIGGWAGAVAGGIAGAWTGAKIGALFGPWAWITVPVFSTAGGVVGAWLGYEAGSHLAEYSVDAWYRSLDSKTKQRVDEWFIQAPSPGAPPN